ncbi:MAG: hypothetical protein AAB605_00215 [Patescibacteria group bacterium]
MAYWKTPALILIISLVATVIVFEYWLGREYIADPCPGEIGLQSSCWTAHYIRMIDERGPLAALHDLKGRYEHGGGARLFCHPILHDIGAAAGKEFGTIAESFRHGDPFCRSGYYHGVMEYLFGEDGGGELLSQLDSICADARGKERYSYDYFACVHGVGHGLMAYFDHELFKSLSGCELLTGSWEQATCAGGVFMENIGADSPEFPSKYLKTDDLVYPCNAVKDSYRQQCFQMQTSYMLKLNGGDFAATFAACRGVEEEYRISCYQSIGRDVSGWTYGDAAEARTLCALGITAEEKSHCLLGVGVDFIQSVGTREARAFCADSPEGERTPCIQGVEWQVQAL